MIPRSDIDIAVKGIPSGSYFEIYAKLMMQLHHPVDLIPLERDNRFGDKIPGKLFNITRRKDCL